MPSYLQHLPPFIQQLQPYQAGRPIEEVMEERNIAIEAISKLASNENPLGPSPLVSREIQNQMQQLHRYPEMAARRLKDLLADHWEVDDTQLVLGNGSEDLIALLIKLLVRPGEEIVSSEKTFVGFYLSAQSFGAKLQLAPMTDDFRFNVERMVSLINSYTRIVYIANPNNPTGTYIKKDEFEWIMEKVPQDCLVIMDEAYFEFARNQIDYPNALNYLNRYPNLLSLRTFSKVYGIAGMRVGYGIGHPQLIQYLHRVKLAFAPGSLAQAAACGALLDKEHLRETINLNANQYPRIFSYLSERGFNPIPSAANFIAFRVSSQELAHTIYEELLNEGVIIRPLKSFFMPGFLRVSLGTENEMDHFVRAMETVYPRVAKML